MFRKILTTGLIAVTACRTLATTNPSSQLENYNVIWDTPSKDHHGSMPLGNGDIGLNVWMEKSGDLCFYIGKTDSWGDNGRLLKVGKVRVSLTPNPLTNGAKFRQTLNLKNGEITVDIKGENPTKLKVWVDANNPLVQVETDSKEPVKASAKIELWRTKQITLPSVEVSDTWSRHPEPAPKTVVEPDVILDDYKNGIGWYHRNIKSVGPDMTMKYQGLDDFKGYRDPLKNRIFGAMIEAKNGIRKNRTTLQTESSRQQSISIAVHTLSPGSVNEWKRACEQTLRKINSAERYAAHVNWWRQFWNRSHISITQNSKSVKSLIPTNSLPLKIGVDQNGTGKFIGKLKVSIESKTLHLSDVKNRYKAGSENAKNTQNDFKDSVSLEAWIKPENPNNSRIIDKITAGKSDGFLVDTYPGNSVRVIVGNKILTHKNCLVAKQWSHIVVVIDSKQEFIKLYFDGKLVASEDCTSEDDAFVVARAYNLQRFIDAAGGRGKYPIKFNGSIFTVPHSGKPGNADYRRWGGGFWWQNTRLPYLSMTMSGDFDMMHSLFRMYVDDILPVAKHRTQKYFGHNGAFFSECLYPWGAVFTQSYGWDKPFKERKDPLQRSRWHKWEWIAGPELVWMMLDYYAFTQDEQFLKEKIIPTADAVITFFDKHYKQNEQGELVMYPSMACETWWDCTNPMPELSGLHGITERLLALPANLTTEKSRVFWRRFLKQLPPLPLRDTKSGKALAPAKEFKIHNNCENPELYGVFPFRRIAVGKENIEWGINALKHRWHRGASGWRQDDLFMAYLGQTEQAKEYIVSRSKNYHKGSRFPAFWGPNYDWIPDQDHGGVLTKAVQSQLMQVDPYSNKIYLLPAWPKEWNAEFKLHAPQQTIVQGKIKNGKVIDLTVTPKSRQKDIIFLR